MRNSVLVTTSKPRASSSDVARQWLVTFGEICGREITPALAAIWTDQLGDIPPDLLQQACDRLAKTWNTNFLPTPGNVRAQIDQANANGLQLEAEQAWLRAFDWVRRYFHPDLGVTRGAPELPAVVRHAIDAAGAMRWIESCPEGELQWARKRFIEDHTRVHETQQSEHLLTRGESKRILASLSRPPVARLLAAPAKKTSTAGVPLPPREEVRAILNRVAGTEIPSEEEWEARKRSQKEKLAQWLAEHPQQDAGGSK